MEGHEKEIQFIMEKIIACCDRGNCSIKSLDYHYEMIGNTGTFYPVLKIECFEPKDKKSY